jgi:intracellular sulfur oxidation DsrE/DsrF family protein
MKLSRLVLLFPLILPASFIATSHADSGYGKQKVVYHVNYDNAKRQAGALRNIQNHINAVGAENLDMKVVMHGKGLSLILTPESAKHTKLKHGNADDNMQAKIAGLKDQGIKFQVCKNTLKGKKVDMAEHLYDVDKSDIVPSGVAELARLQSQGYSYIRP